MDSHTVLFLWQTTVGFLDCCAALFIQQFTLRVIGFPVKDNFVNYLSHSFSNEVISFFFFLNKVFNWQDVGLCCLCVQGLSPDKLQRHRQMSCNSQTALLKIMAESRPSPNVSPTLRST